MSLPVVYSCSGCSSAAQLANRVALGLHREGIAEMSCIAGVGGDVPALVRVAKSGRPLVALDGCALHCVRSALDRHDLTAMLQLNLNDLGVAKVVGEDYDPQQADEVQATVARRLADLLADSSTGQ